MAKYEIEVDGNWYEVDVNSPDDLDLAHSEIRSAMAEVKWLTARWCLKLKAEYNKFLTWSQSTDSPNKTAAYYQFNVLQDPASPEAPAVEDDSRVKSDAEAAAQSSVESGTTKSGIKYRKVGGAS